MDYSPQQKLFIATLKSTLMTADIAGSALPKHTEDIRTWLKERLQTTLRKNQLQGVVTQKIKGKKLRPFQEKVREIQGQEVHGVLLKALRDKVLEVPKQGEYDRYFRKNQAV